MAVIISLKQSDRTLARFEISHEERLLPTLLRPFQGKHEKMETLAPKIISHLNERSIIRMMPTDENELAECYMDIYNLNGNLTLKFMRRIGPNFVISLDNFLAQYE